MNLVVEETHPRGCSVKNKWTDALNAAASAMVADIISDFLFYGLDSYKTMQQAGKKNIQYSKLFRGALPIAISGSGPPSGLFFILYNPLRNSMNEQFGPGCESVSVLAASVVAGVPASLLSVPADVVKKHVLLGGADCAITGRSYTTWQTTKHLVRTEGKSRLFLGWRANVYKDTAFTMLEMSLYEGLARTYLNYFQAPKLLKNRTTSEVNASVNADCLSNTEAAGVGFVSGVLTAIATCPIDCVNTRIKSGELAQYSIWNAHFEIVHRNGIQALFRGLVARSMLHGIGATVFWYIKASTMHFLNGNEGV